MAIKIGAQRDDIDALKTVLEDESIEYKEEDQTKAELGDGPNLVASQDWDELVLEAATGVALGGFLDEGFGWLERWFTNQVDEGATPPKVTLIEEKAIEKGSITLDPSKPDESLQEFKLFLEGRVVGKQKFP